MSRAGSSLDSHEQQHYHYRHNHNHDHNRLLSWLKRVQVAITLVEHEHQPFSFYCSTLQLELPLLPCPILQERANVVSGHNHIRHRRVRLFLSPILLLNRR
ncbi:unnamed protein product [Ectocarpus sp. 8 AP-2014]